MKNAYQVANNIIHLANIDFINEGDSTTYNPPRIVLKSGQIIPINGDWQGYEQLKEAYLSYEPADNS